MINHLSTGIFFCHPQYIKDFFQFLLDEFSRIVAEIDTQDCRLPIQTQFPQHMSSIKMIQNNKSWLKYQYQSTNPSKTMPIKGTTTKTPKLSTCPLLMLFFQISQAIYPKVQASTVYPLKPSSSTSSAAAIAVTLRSRLSPLAALRAW